MLHVWCRLFEFQRDYEVQVAPLLIQADTQITRIDEMFSVDWQDEAISLSLVRQKQALIRGVSVKAFSCVAPHSSLSSCRADTSHNNLSSNHPPAG